MQHTTTIYMQDAGTQSEQDLCCTTCCREPGCREPGQAFHVLGALPSESRPKFTLPWQSCACAQSSRPHLPLCNLPCVTTALPHRLKSWPICSDACCCHRRHSCLLVDPGHRSMQAPQLRPCGRPSRGRLLRAAGCVPPTPAAVAACHFEQVEGVWRPRGCRQSTERAGAARRRATANIRHAASLQHQRRCGPTETAVPARPI